MNERIGEDNSGLLKRKGDEEENAEIVQGKERTDRNFWSAKKIQGVCVVSSGLMSCLLYSFCSISMVLTNKLLASSLPPISLLAMQNLVATVCVMSCKYLGFVEYNDFEWKMAMAWLPVNIIFVGMLSSSFFALRYLSVPMITVFKQLSNFLTLLGEWYLFGHTATPGAIFAILIMILGATVAADLDIDFSAIGYAWQLINCVMTSAYVLYLKHAVTTIKLPKFGMVFYNNLLSIPLLLFIAACNREFSTVYSALYSGVPIQNTNNHDPTHNSSIKQQHTATTFLILNFIAGTIGFVLNFASLWCVSATSATTYSIVGALNKVPITIIGFFLFETHITRNGAISIAASLCGGLLYTAAKIYK